MALADLDARGPQQHRGLALVRGIGTVDLDLGDEHRDAMRLRDRRHGLDALQLAALQPAGTLAFELGDRLHGTPVAVDVVVGAGERSVAESRAGLLDRAGDRALVEVLELAGEVHGRALAATSESAHDGTGRFDRRRVALGIERGRLRGRDHTRQPAGEFKYLDKRALAGAVETAGA